VENALSRSREKRQREAEKAPLCQLENLKKETQLLNVTTGNLRGKVEGKKRQ